MMINLNLIPQNKKEEIIQAGHFRNILKWEFEMAGIVLAFILILVSMNYILKINFLSVQNSISQNPKDIEKIEEIARYDKEIKNINVKISEITKVSRGQLHWSNFFNRLNEDMPAEISLDSISTQGYRVSLGGNAKTREALITLKENLEKDECFGNVNLPLSNLVDKANVEFQIFSDIDKECLKN